MKMKSILGLHSPWIIYNEKVNALFRRDMGVDVDYDDAQKVLTLRVKPPRKADALSRLIPETAEFGNVKVLQRIVPGNIGEDCLPEDAPMIEVIKAAFDGNNTCVDVRPVSKGLFKNLTYCIFAKEVIQYPADNLADLNGQESTLMECIAREVLTKADGVFFCTSVSCGGLLASDNQQLDKPLGEWP